MIIPVWLIKGITFLIISIGGLSVVVFLMVIIHLLLDTLLRYSKFYPVWLEFARYYLDKKRRGNIE